jgi:N-methylhydantoinase A
MAENGSGDARLGVDIGGTFTDVALETAARRHTLKVLTTRDAPERGVMEAIAAVLGETGMVLAEVALAIHGTTLATNALIERKGARTALVTTEGFRDSLEMGTESRFEQYDIFMEKPRPLVPRRRRFPVPERMNARGEVLVPLDEAALEALVPALDRAQVESVAIGFLHSFINADHEERARDILARHLPGIPVSLSSEVSPEMREYERFSTTCANAYVQPLMARYLADLEQALRERGFAGPLFLMLSGGGLATVETAIRFPIRLIESGPAGGAIFAGGIAAASGLGDVLSFDMGGTTAKICLIDGGEPQTARSFEVARVYRFLKGSGLPIRVPAIEMVEVGAGGGSIARIDQMGRIAVGPDSAGSEPGPACYGRGGREATVTDADLAMGRIDPAGFSGGRLALDGCAAAKALDGTIGGPLGLDGALAAYGVGEMVDENMANAARVHAIESGKSLEARTLIAFGGAAPLHAARVAERLGIGRVVVPPNAGVGSAVGFLRAPVAYEVVRSNYQRLAGLDTDAVSAMLEAMGAEAHRIVESGAAHAPRTEERTGFMRYVGQGHEIAVPVPVRTLGADDRAAIRGEFERTYETIYGRAIPGVDIEILSWVVRVAASAPRTEEAAAAPRTEEAASAPRMGKAVEAENGNVLEPSPEGERPVFDPASGAFLQTPIYRREALAPGARISGPAVIAEDETSTVVTPAFDATVDGDGNIVLIRRGEGERT